MINLHLRTVKEVATILACSTHVVYDLIDEGYMEAFDLSRGQRRSWRIPASAVEKYLDSAKKTPYQIAR